MGAIFSRPVNYVKTKVTNTRDAIIKKVTDTRDAAVKKVTDTRDGICTKAVNTKNAVVGTFVGIKDGICTRVTNFKNGVTTRVNNFVTGVKNRYNRTVKFVNNTRCAVKNRYDNTKNAVKTRYTSAKDGIQTRYRKIREAKLTRAQKIKYGILAVLLLISFTTVSLISWDIYQGDYESAQAKVDAIKEFSLYIGEQLSFVGENLLYATKVACAFIWEQSKIGGAYLWEGTQYCGRHLWYGTQVAGEYAAHGAVVVGQYTASGAKLGAEYAVEGTKVGAQYAWEGSKLAYQYGSVGAKEGAIWLYNGSICLAVNVAEGLYYGTIHLLHTLKVVSIGLLTGSYSASEIFIDGSSFMLNKTYHGSMYVFDKTYNGAIILGSWTHTATTTAYEWACITCAFIAHWTTVGTGKFTSGTVSSVTFLWDWTCTICTTSYEWTCIAFDRTCKGTVVTVTFIWDWSYWIVTAGSKGLYVGLNKYGLRWFYVVTSKLAEWACALGLIVAKFFGAVGTKFGNFFVVAGTHIYNLLYIVVAFLLQILLVFMGLVKLILDGLVYCVTFLFSGVIWVLDQLSTAYMFALHKYNMYREGLFFGFIALITIYCTGLLRDRARSEREPEEDEIDFGDESEDEFALEEEGEDEEDSEKAEVPKFVGPGIPRKGSYDLSPVYEERPPVPAYEEETLSELSDDLCPDQEVPDFMNLSGGESDRDINLPEGHTGQSTDEELRDMSDEHDDDGTRSKTVASDTKKETEQILKGRKGDLEQCVPNIQEADVSAGIIADPEHKSASSESKPASDSILTSPRSDSGQTGSLDRAEGETRLFEGRVNETSARKQEDRHQRRAASEVAIAQVKSSGDKEQLNIAEQGDDKNVNRLSESVDKASSVQSNACELNAPEESEVNEALNAIDIACSMEVDLDSDAAIASVLSTDDHPDSPENVPVQETKNNEEEYQLYEEWEEEAIISLPQIEQAQESAEAISAPGSASSGESRSADTQRTGTSRDADTSGTVQHKDS